MQSTRDIRRRIKSVRNTQQITRAMKMVAAARLRKAQMRVLAARPYARAMEQVFRQLVAITSSTRDPGELHPLLARRTGGRRLYIVVGADRGLAGAYNPNIMKLTLRDAETAADVSFVAIGRKARDFLRFRRLRLRGEFMQADEPDYGLARTVVAHVADMFANNEIDEVRLVYSRFISVMTQKPVVTRLLPLVASSEDGGGDGGGGERTDGGGTRVYAQEITFEPSAQEMLALLIPKYLETIVFHAMMEGKAGEFGARMTAMDAATRNAEEMIETLTLSYNRARQAAITKEITEIVGGAQALEQARV